MSRKIMTVLLLGLLLTIGVMGCGSGDDARGTGGIRA